ncbi:hypothetical protein SUGI_1146620 [Cryptomeria japonica]|nr:hypothetical protein SUGI_1146620 [Cryptomeria japonica]
MNARTRLPPEAIVIQLVDGTHVEPNSHPYQMDPELDNTDRVAILNLILTSLVGALTANDIGDCTIETDTSNSDPEDEEDVLNNLDPRCISQSANTILGRTKGAKGRKSNRQIREKKSTEKGIVSVLDFIKSIANSILSLSKNKWISILKTYFQPDVFLPTDSEDEEESENEGSDDSNDSERNKAEHERLEKEELKEMMRTFEENAWEVFKCVVLNEDMAPFHQVTNSKVWWFSTGATETVTNVGEFAGVIM